VDRSDYRFDALTRLSARIAHSGGVIHADSGISQDVDRLKWDTCGLTR
jgi:hypothetical protein